MVRVTLSRRAHTRPLPTTVQRPWPSDGPRRASIAVELALLAPLVIVIIFGILEFGLLFSDMAYVSHAAREGSRQAAVGRTTTEVTATIRSAAAMLDLDQLAITLTYRTWTGEGWSDWVTLTDVAGANVAPPGSQIQVAVTYAHRLVMGPMFARLATDPEARTVALSSSRITNRE